MDDTQADGNIPTLDEVFGFILSLDNIGAIRNSNLRAYLDALPEDLLASGIQHNPDNSSQQQLQQQEQLEPADPLNILDPSAYSLGYLYIITARCTMATQENALLLYRTLCQFINVADMKQLVLSGVQMNRIITSLEYLAQVRQDPMIPLEPLFTLINRLTFFSSSNGGGVPLTIFHSALAKHCILSKMYQYPMPILNCDIVQVNPKTYATSIEHYLEYHYYGAILYIGNKEYEKAVEFLTLVISAPVQKATSAIQLEAYKRYILVSLIAHGKLYALPKYVPTVIEKTCKKLYGAYFAVMDAFDTDDMKKLTKSIEKYQQTFEADGTLGLVNQLIQASYRRKIKMLTNIYVKVKLDDLGRQISVNASPSPMTKDQIEHLLVDMIGKNYINASISIVMEQGTPVKMVEFHEETTSSTTYGSSQQLEEAINRITRVNDQVSDMDKIEGLTMDFQGKYLVLSANDAQSVAPPTATIDEDMDVPLLNDD